MTTIRFRFSKLRLFLISALIIYIIYLLRDIFQQSSDCSIFYNQKSFERCILMNNTRCNLSTLLDIYMQYRTCALTSSSSHYDYIVFDAVNGLGNRVFGLISVTMYALMTGRVLIINWKPGDNHQALFEDLFIPLLPSSSSWFIYQMSVYRLIHLIRYRWINQIQWHLEPNRIPQDWSFYFDPELLCHHGNNPRSSVEQFGLSFLKFVGQHVLWIRTDQYFVPLLTRNQKYRSGFEHLSVDGQIFHQLVAKLLQPTFSVKKIVEEFEKRTQFSQKTLKIGVHMRSWSSTIIGGIKPFQNCIEQVYNNITRFGKKEIKVSLYVISNTPIRRQNLINSLLKTLPDLEIWDPPATPIKANDSEKMRYTLAELLILSKMSHLIISSKSTFGMVAQGLAGHGAWIVRQGAVQEKSSIKLSSCQWGSTSEPEYQMMGKIDENEECVRQNILKPSVGERTNSL